MYPKALERSFEYRCVVQECIFAKPAFCGKVTIFLFAKVGQWVFVQSPAMSKAVELNASVAKGGPLRLLESSGLERRKLVHSEQFYSLIPEDWFSN